MRAEKPEGVQLPADPNDRPGGPEVDNELPGHGGVGSPKPDNTLPKPPRASPRHEAGIEGPDEALPTDLRAGNMVVFHLSSQFRPGASEYDNLHRAALVNSVYATDVVEATPTDGGGARDVTAPVTKEAHVDLTVFLCSGDDPGRTFPLLLITDVVYDSECPEGTFCLIEDGADDLPTVGDVTAEVNPLERKKNKGR